MKLILIRHGESAQNVGLDKLGEDNNLTLKGVHQAVEAGKNLIDTKINAIYCSPSDRCVQTLDEVLRVRDDDFPIHLTKLLGPKTSLEPFEKLKARVELFLDDLKYDQGETDTVVIISHQLVIRMIIFQITGNDRNLENGETVELEMPLAAKVAAGADGDDDTSTPTG